MRTKVSPGAVVRMAAAEAASMVRSRNETRLPEEPVAIEAHFRDLRPLDEDFEWSKESYNKVLRSISIWRFILSTRARLALLDAKWSYPGGFTEEKKSERARRLAKDVRESILRLGPTFIKLGQLFSARSDILTPEFTEELSLLQDRVPRFSAEKARRIIARELGRPASEVFRRFDDVPIAAASLGQVHRAQLHTGEDVVVKVQRPGLKELFAIDLENLLKAAELLDRGDDSRDFVGIYQECAMILYQEIDYINEGRFANRFRRNFRDAPWVKVPAVFWECSSPSVLTLEYCPGVKISDIAALGASGLDVDTVARRATESYLIQILKHGFFHADPHPGNVAVDPKDGALIYYDFGMMGEIVPTTRESLLEVFYAFYRKDADAVLQALTDLQVIVPTGDTISVRRAISFFIDSFERQTQEGEALANIGEDLFAIALDQPFRFPATFTFVLRAFTTLEGIGKTLNPDYKFAAVATPYANELLNLEELRSQRYLVQQLQAEAERVGSAAAAVPLRVQHIDSFVSQVERGDLKIRVRVFEAERAARRQGVMQLATINSIFAVGLLNIGTQLGLRGAPLTPAVLVATGIFGVRLLLNMRRVARLDRFEKRVKG